VHSFKRSDLKYGSCISTSETLAQHDSKKVAWGQTPFGEENLN
jgi:hypothetical protein